MSDNYIRVIPTEPTFIPTRAAAQAAAELLTSYAPYAESIEAIDTGKVEFIDAGDNFEGVRCPLCQMALTLEWWVKHWEYASDNKFMDLAVETPCCRTLTSLNDLDYDWAVGFARWCLSARNCNTGKLSPEQVAILGQVLGHEVRIIYTHY